MADYSFASMARVLYSRKRGNLTGSFDTLPGLMGTPRAPVDAETRLRLGIDTPNVTWEIHFQGAPDIRKGDRLLLSGLEYPVFHCEKWPWLPSDDTRLRVIVEDVRNGV